MDSGKEIALGDAGVLTVSNVATSQKVFVKGVKVNGSGLNGTYYPTLETAVEKAASGDTITLLDDVTLSNDLTIKKDLTMELNSKTLKMEANSINLSEDKNISLTVKNGKIESKNRNQDENAGFSVHYGNKLVLENVIVSDSDVEGIWFTPAFIFLESSIDSGEEAKCPELVISGSNMTTDGNVLIEVSSGTDAFKNTKNFAKVTISDSTLNSSGIRTVSITGPSSGTIEGTTISGDGPTVVDISGGTHIIKDSHIIFNKSNTTYGQALEVGGDNGGGDYCAADVTLDNVTLTVNKSDENIKALTVSGTAGGLTPRLTGTFSSNIGTYSVAETADVYLTTNDGKTIFTSGIENFEKAVSEAESGQTIKLLSNLDLTQFKPESAVVTKKDYEFKNENITLDLNGKTVYTNNYGVVWRGKNLTIQNGTFEVGKDSNNNYGSYALFIRGTNDDSQLTDLEKAEWTAYVKNVKCIGGINAGCHKVEISGETDIKGTVYYALWADENSTITVLDGTYTSDGTCGYGSVIASSSKGNIIVEGGTYTGKEKVPVFKVAPYNKFTVKGGTFNANPKDYVDETSYTVTENTETKTWTVTKK